MEQSPNITTESMHPIHAKDVVMFAHLDSTLAEYEA